MKLFILIALVGSASAALSTLQSEQVLAVHMQKTREVHKVFDSLIEVAHAQKRAASLGAKGFINQDVETANQQTVGMALPAGVNFAHIWTAMMHHMKHNPILQEEIAKHDSFVEMANKAYAGKADMKMMESIFASDGIDLKTGRDLAKGPKGGAKPSGKSSGKSSAASGAGSGKVPEGDGLVDGSGSSSGKFMDVMKMSAKQALRRMRNAAKSVGACLAGIKAGDAWSSFQEVSIGIGISLPGLTFGLPIGWGPFVGDTTEYAGLADTPLASSDNGLVGTSFQADLGNALGGGLGGAVTASDVSSFYGTASSEWEESEDSYLVGTECLFNNKPGRVFSKLGDITTSLIDGLKKAMFGADYDKPGPKGGECMAEEGMRKAVKFFVAFAVPALNGAAFGFTNQAVPGGMCDTYLNKQWVVLNLLRAAKKLITGLAAKVKEAVIKPDGKPAAEDGVLDPAAVAVDKTDPQQARTIDVDAVGSGTSAMSGTGSSLKGKTNGMNENDQVNKDLEAPNPGEKPKKATPGQSAYFAGRMWGLQVTPICIACVFKSKSYTCQTNGNNLVETVKACANALVKKAKAVLSKVASKLKAFGGYLRDTLVKAVKAGKKKVGHEFCTSAVGGFFARHGLTTDKCAARAAGTKKLLLLEQSSTLHGRSQQGLRGQMASQMQVGARGFLSRIMQTHKLRAGWAKVRMTDIVNCDGSGGFTNCIKASASSGYEISAGAGVPTASISFGFNLQINLWKILGKILGLAKVAGKATFDAAKATAKSVKTMLDAQLTELKTKAKEVPAKLGTAIWEAIKDFIQFPFAMIYNALAIARKDTKTNPRTLEAAKGVFLELPAPSADADVFDKMMDVADLSADMLEETFAMERDGHVF
jgi:hypothetical protein